jgi:hypothetical protein
VSDRQENGSFWLGGSDGTIEGLWTWYTNGMDIQYTNWSPGQPDSPNGIDEDCLCIYGSHNYTWDDVPCTGYKLHPLCEIR